MDLFDIVVARKLSGGGGGGGSSDFSTAEVTLQLNASGSGLSINGACLREDGGVEYIDTTYSVESGVTKAVLYKGEGSIFIQSLNPLNVSVSGNIQKMGSTGYLITGDGTITIS